MDLLHSYADDEMDDEEQSEEQPQSSNQNPNSQPFEHLNHSPDSSPVRMSLPSKSAAPKVNDTMLALTVAGSAARALSKPLDPTQHTVSFNPTYDQLWAPIYGPAHPYAKDGLAQGLRNHKLGFVENAAIEPFVFDEQYNTFQKYGYAFDPSANNFVGDMDALKKNDAISVYNIPQHEQKKRKLEKKKEMMENDQGDGEEDVDAAEVDNPATEVWLRKNRKSPWSGKKEGLQTELTEEQKKYAEEYAKKKGEEKGEREKGEHLVEKSTFHGKEERDYQGRSWIAPPKDAKPQNDHCYIPKRLVHTWSGHTKGVSAIRFFPKHGHLILSAGMDTKVKIWDVFNSGKCMRTYMGHSKAVRDIWFCNDGTKFLTASYDKNIKYWDTETGKVISTFSTGKVPYVVRLNPDEDKQNVLLAGMSDKKIVQWDINTGQITQEYDQHLGAVNTITFVDDNRRFVTSSDDKSLRVWEFGIPVVIKYISEPHMHSMPSISPHPNGNWLAAQSLDNQILIYSARERFQLNKKKRFAGHVVAGYACQVNFSPDGRFVLSGDGEGRCWFWDWKSCKVFRTLKCHDGVCIGCEWHPLEQSKVATCGWDGLIKYWD
ncbi:pre-mRNA-processing factor 17-like isoform X1 [Ipomoea triloba]|uniref:pre-mRNA-processing factor 17-like isoform X1 n=2 Tax=Ipomoea triloba TaxID=35885 RepID=UPI00125E5E34|nr:pre-mRNA-processing factor 17-like isoform X1 [Ipomoea triloba]XP_031127893.1 pre-mRNA-processing factor 17-like isoform X1 [Ipomoea triloba]XP_031127902.1 pre-mRNA-processing factor 17-like isoform X1 [Ipomoea triloba]XP_031127909.1 pre-mRNA-processing factor 17-like isoform X1 [Ipomoea triloba]XP_031127921.1 pre-mRNA-processing factor 17-like isoform X1 [Ipomoea triloba]XP_031127930.1 pre-mRNA-processing factor 17-like isoform X1 [Ipomoea triloba]